MPKILYIEDDANNRLLVRRILLAADFEVTEAANAPEGIDLATKNPPDLILMDINMPGMDGLTATKQIRSIPALTNIPIIALTANVMQGDKEKTLNAGCDGYIGKPIDVDKFPDLVASYLKKNHNQANQA